MVWNWFETAAVMALMFSVGSIWELMRVRKHIHLDDLTPTRKWKKAIKGPKYIPKHKSDKLSGNERGYEIQFFKDFSKVADLLNTWHTDSPWSFENNGKLDSGYGSESGAEREIDIRFNQQKTGWIRISCWQYGGLSGEGAFDEIWSDRVGKIDAKLVLVNGRCFDGFEVLGLASALADIISDQPEVREEVTKNMMRVMINSMWQIGEDIDVDPTIEISVRGQALWYLKEWLPKHC
jgi:hypothetical protein